jgi:ketosteroid isomerase-like protein
MDYLELAERFVTAIESADVDAIRACYAPDARIWHNFDDIEQSVDENLTTLSWLVKRLPERRYEVQRREALADGFLQQHVLTGITRTGDRFALPACIVCRVAESRITRLDEYLDMAGAAALYKGDK